MVAKYALPRPSVRLENFVSSPVFSFQLFDDKHLKWSENIPETTLRPKSGDFNLKMIDSVFCGDILPAVIYYIYHHIMVQTSFPLFLDC